MKPWSLLCSITAHLLLILLFFVASSWFKPDKPELEIIPLELELDDTQPPAPALQPAPQPAQPEPEPEPPAPEPEPEPEPEPPAPEPEPVPEPPAPEPPVATLPEKPQPQEVRKPDPKPAEKPRQPTLAERMAEAQKNTRTIKPRQPEKPPKPPRNIDQDINRLLANNTSTRSGVTMPSTSSVAGVSAAQQNNYARYMSRCVMPMMDALWQQLGPNGLDSTPSPVVLTFYVSPNGTVSSSLIATRSNSSQMNDAANAVAAQLSRQGLPPFSTVGLSTERNAALPITITLKYQR